MGPFYVRCDLVRSRYVVFFYFRLVALSQTLVELVHIALVPLLKPFLALGTLCFGKVLLAEACAVHEAVHIVPSGSLPGDLITRGHSPSM